jgi:hypothetical protein
LRIDRNRRRLVLNRIALVVCRHPNVLRRSQCPVALRNTRTLAYDKRVDHRLRRPALLKVCYRNPETGTIGQATCNLYSITTNQEAITRPVSRNEPVRWQSMVGDNDKRGPLLLCTRMKGTGLCENPRTVSRLAIGRGPGVERDRGEPGRYMSDASPHQFRTRNAPTKARRRRSNSSEKTAKSTNPIDIPPLITVWLQVRVLPGRSLAHGPLVLVGTDDLSLRNHRKRRQPICTPRFLILR